MVALGGRLRGSPETGEKASEVTTPPPSSKAATSLQVSEASAPEVGPGGRLYGAELQLRAASMSASAAVFNPPTATSRPIVGYVQNINRASVALSFLRIDPDGNTSGQARGATIGHVTQDFAPGSSRAPFMEAGDLSSPAPGQTVKVSAWDQPYIGVPVLQWSGPDLLLLTAMVYLLDVTTWLAAKTGDELEPLREFNWSASTGAELEREGKRHRDYVVESEVSADSTQHAPTGAPTRGGEPFETVGGEVLGPTNLAPKAAQGIEDSLRFRLSLPRAQRLALREAFPLYGLS